MTERQCSHCGTHVGSGQQLCSRCGSALDEIENPSESVSAPEFGSRGQNGLPEHSRKRMLTTGRIIIYTIALLIALFLLALAIPDVKRSSRPTPSLVCPANMRVLQGAIDIWEMDNENHSFHSGVLVNRDGTQGPSGLFLTPHYLKKLPHCPSHGEYRYDENSHTVSCTIHGSLAKPVKP